MSSGPHTKTDREFETRFMRVRPGLFAFRAGELLSYTAGIALTGFFAVQMAQGEVERRQGIAAFEAGVAAGALSAADRRESEKSMAAPVVVASEPGRDLLANAELAMTTAVPDSLNPANFEHLPSASDAGEPDTTLWAPSRVASYQRSLDADLPGVLAVLEVPSVGLKVPVYSEDTDLTMDRGAGIINGMAFPHEPGNIGISGHRDGYFRALKDVNVGDEIILQTLEGPKHFVINATQVVEIADTALLQDTRQQTVTCYPFYFVGHAPQRFIVTASLDTTNVNHN